MSDSLRPSVPKWPFFLGNALMLGVAFFARYESPARLDHISLAIICGCVALGALLGVLPFILDYRIALRLAESASLTSAVDRLQNLEGIAQQIALATGQWQTVQEHSTKAVTAATEIGDRMTQEAKAFAEFYNPSEIWSDEMKARHRAAREKMKK